MGACMAHQNRKAANNLTANGNNIYSRFSWRMNKAPRTDNNVVTFSKEQSMLLDMWNEKHIQILKKRFAVGLTGKKSNCLDYQGFLRVFDHTKRIGYESGPSILQHFGAAICKQAFRLFDSSKFGAIIFRDFCCALSIICLGSSDEKIRFLFDLFDLDRDGFLSRKELVLMFQQLIHILIKPEEQTKRVQRVRQQWVDLQVQYFATSLDHIDFYQFQAWAEAQIDIFKVLQVFELVPSPYREHEIIQQILDSNARKHGDTMYVLSYRWWDNWKEYTEKDPSTIEVQQFVEKVRQSIAQNPQMTNEMKQLVLGINDDGTENDQKTPGSDIKCSLERAEWASNKQDPNKEVNEDLGLSFSMRQQIALSRRRTSAVSSNQQLLVGTPRMKMSQVSMPTMNMETSKIEESDIDLHTKFEKMDRTPPCNEGTMNQAARTATVGFSIPSELVNRDKQEPYIPKPRTQPKSFSVPQSQNITRNSHNVQSSMLVEERIESSIEDSPEEPINDNQERRESQMSSSDRPYQSGQSPIKRRLTAVGKLKQLVHNPNSGMERAASSKSLKGETSVTSLMRLQESNAVPQVTNNYGNRPLAVDNSDIEGEHPGQMQPNLIMYRDFVTIPEQAWNLFCLWYGQSQQSPVFARKVLMHNSIASMELYPPRISCVLADREGKPIADSQKSLFVSTSLNLSEVHLKICELFNYISTRDTRLWVKGEKGVDQNQQNEWTKVVPETHFVKDGDVFMVEVKFYGNQWPMDAKSGEAREWQQFEIGDKIDVKDGETWKVGQIDKVNKDSLKIHLVNENWKNDLTIRKDSELLAQCGTHTLVLHFKQDQLINLPEGQIQGIKNIGNTCYMNAILQALFHTPLFQDYFKTLAFKFFLQQKKEPDMICEAFANMMGQPSVSTEVISVYEPTDFKKAVNTTLPLFFGNQQQDSAEFFNFMLDKMNEEMNRVDKKLPELPSSPIAPKPNAQSTLLQPDQAKSDQKKDASGEVGGTGGAAKLTAQSPAEFGENQSKPEETHRDILEEQRLKENSERIKLQMQQQAIKDAKQNVYSEFFNKPLTVSQAGVRKTSSSFSGTLPLIHQQSAGDQTQDKLVQADSLNPNISALEAKARAAWFSALNDTSSPISDMFVGQQTTEVTCLGCKAKSHTFENFYSLPIPLPANRKSTFYVHLVRWQRRSKVIQPIIAYGVQINKYLKLSNLVDELRKITSLSDQFSICEISNSKVYRVHEEAGSSLLSLVLKRTNQLYIFEHPQHQVPQPQLLHQQSIPSQKGTQSPARLLSASSQFQSRQNTRANYQVYQSFEEITPGMLIDAQDQYLKWYVGLVVDKQRVIPEKQSPAGAGVSEDAAVSGEVPCNETYRVCVHFYQLHSKFDEWYEETPENLRRLKPLGASGQAEQPKDSLIKVIMMHRRSLGASEALKQNEPQQQQYIGLPYCLNVQNWLTWKGLRLEISYQVMKHIKQQTHSAANIDPSIDTEEGNVQNHENDKPLTLNTKQFDSLRRPGHILVNNAARQQSPSSILNFSNKLNKNDSNKRLLEPINNKYVRISSGQPIQQPPTLSESSISAQNPPPSLLKKPTIQSLLAIVPEDGTCSHFKIKVLCGETHKCVFCLLKFRCKTADGGQTQAWECKQGCPIPNSEEQVKYTLALFKKIEIVIDWDGANSYQDAPIHYDSSHLRLKKQESEVISGIPLGSCLDLYSKKEKIEGYQCDSCKSQTTALIKPLISHLPDILVLHIKRFNFESGYLDKIEDLVTFPLRNLDMSRHLIQGLKQNASYDLYAVVNHHMYQTGGHYTAAMQLSREQEQNVWMFSNDSIVTQIKNPQTDLVNKDAYMLFYKRRELTPSNILKLTHQH